MTQQYDLTGVGVNPAEDRAHRMRVYFVTMTIRVLCVVSLFFVRGWWVLLVGLGAVILPYVAVLIANQAASGGGATPETPSPLELGAADLVASTGTDEAGHAAETLLIVDAPAERRSTRPAAAEGVSSHGSGAAEGAAAKDGTAEGGTAEGGAA